MKLIELLPKEAVVEGLGAKDKKGALKALVEALRASRKPPRPKLEPILRALVQRESIGTTGIGGGVALPHAKIEGIPSIMGAFGRLSTGLDWGAVDGERVDLVFVLVSPASDPNLHLAALQRLNRGIRLPNMARFLRAAKSAREISDLFREMDEAVGG
ncbi:MAG: PTS sugar transporter subunit IIA [Candidatus Brocadiae bacterium]|nr:PTS sugar transporter subunit IIA [Candidatus Brocadiia bacterium]